MGDMHDHDIPELPGDREISGIFSEPARAEAQKAMASEFPGRMAVSREDVSRAIRYREALREARSRWFWIGVTVGMAIAFATSGLILHLAIR